MYQWYWMKNVALGHALHFPAFVPVHLFLCQAYLPFRSTCCSVSAASSTGAFLIATECYLNLSYSTSHHTMNYNYVCMYFISSSRIGLLMLRVMPASSCILCLAQSPEWVGTQEIFCQWKVKRAIWIVKQLHHLREVIGTLWTGVVKRILLGLNKMDICFSFIEPAVEGCLVFPWHYQGPGHLSSYSAILCWWLPSITSPHCPK